MTTIQHFELAFKVAEKLNWPTSQYWQYTKGWWVKYPIPIRKFKINYN